MLLTGNPFPHHPSTFSVTNIMKCLRSGRVCTLDIYVCGKNKGVGASDSDRC